MKLSENDVARIEQIILDAGETLRRDTIKLEGNKLTFRVDGSDRDGNLAIVALMKAGLNVYSDGNLDTLENFSTRAEGATSADVTMTIADGGLWR